MTRRADIVNALKENHTAFASHLGFPLPADLHRGWCREMVFGTEDHTLQEHVKKSGIFKGLQMGLRRMNSDW